MVLVFLTEVVGVTTPRSLHLNGVAYARLCFNRCALLIQTVLRWVGGSVRFAKYLRAGTRHGRCR